MMIRDDIFICDYCKGDKGEFNDETGNHVSCERIADLEAFFRELIELADWPEGGDIDGFEFQDAAVKHGLLIPEQRTEPCGEGCNCNQYYSDEEWTEGVICYRLAPALLKAAQS
jgi:hypothetical protein